MTIISRILGDIKDLPAARSEVEIARRKLTLTIHQVEAGLAPTNLIQGAIEEARLRSASLTHKAGAAAAARPALATIGAFALMISLVIKPVLRSRRRRAQKRDASRRGAPATGSP